MDAMKVRDFAKMVGCSPQNVYQHIKNYANNLEGHIWKGPGRVGMILDEEAQNFLRGIMYPKEIAEATLVNEINALRAQLLQEGNLKAQLAARLATVEGERDRAQLELGVHQKALAAANDDKEALEAAIERRDQNLAKVEGDLDRARQEALETAQKLEILRQELEVTIADRDAQRAQNEALRHRSWWERLTRKGE